MDRTRRAFLRRWGIAAVAASASGCGSVTGSNPTTERAASGAAHPEFRVRASPLVTADAVYVTTHYGDLYRLDRESGALDWQFEMGGSLGQPAVAGDALYVGDFAYSGDADAAERSRGRVFAIDRATGAERWRRRVEGNPVHTPVVRDGTVYVGVRYYGVYAVDAATGDVNWRVRTGVGGADRSGLVVRDGTAYVANEERLFAVDTATAELDWIHDERSSPIDLTFADDRLYYGSFDGAYCYDVADGERRWRAGPENRFATGPAVGPDAVYFGVNDFFEDTYRLYAVDPATGDRQWAATQPASAYRPTVHDGDLFVPRGNGVLAVVDPATGEPRWTFEEARGMRMRCAPTVVDGVAYVGNNGGDVYTIDVESGEQQWHTWLHRVSEPDDRGES